MKIKIGNKEIGFTIRDVIYILTLVAIGCGWFVSYKITKFKNELKDQVQDEEIAELKEENRKLKLETQNNKEYAKENANNIDWLTAIAGLDTN